MTYTLTDFSLAKIEGSFICIIDGKETVYDNAKDLLAAHFDKKYEVSSIAARGEQVVVTLQESTIIPNDLKTEWAKKQKEETGKEVTFF